ALRDPSHSDHGTSWTPAENPARPRRPGSRSLTVLDVRLLAEIGDEAVVLLLELLLANQLGQVVLDLGDLVRPLRLAIVDLEQVEALRIEQRRGDLAELE